MNSLIETGEAHEAVSAVVAVEEYVDIKELSVIITQIKIGKDE